MKRVILLLVNALLISSVVCFAQDPQYYTVYWSVNGNVISNQSEEAGSFISMTPEAPMPSDCMGNGYTYVGWTDTPISGSQGWEPTPLYTNVSDFPSVTQDITYYAVFRSDATAGGGTYETVDVLNREMTGATNSSTYIDWSNVTANSSAVYAGNSAGGNDAIQIRSSNNNSGIVTTASGGTATKITVEWESNTTSGRTINVYGKNEPYTSAYDLYNGSEGTLIGTIVCGSSTELLLDASYEYIGLRSASSALYLTSISIVWSTPGAGGMTEYVTSCGSGTSGGDATSGTLTSGQSWSLDDGRLSITGGGNIAGFEDPEGVPWYNRRNEITTLYLSADFFSIGSYVFYDLPNLTSISCMSSYVPTLQSNTFNPSQLEMITLNIRQSLNYEYMNASYWQQMKIVPFDDGGSAGDVTTGTMDNGIIWAFDADANLLTISGVGQMPDFESEWGVPWYEYAGEIDSVIVSEGITYIGNNAFAACTTLTKAAFPSTTDSIGVNIFSNHDQPFRLNLGAFIPPGITYESFNNVAGQLYIFVWESLWGLYSNTPIWENLMINSNGNPQDIEIMDVIDNRIVWYISYGTLYFLGSGDIPGYTDSSDQPWAEYRNGIHNVRMEGTFALIGAYAFAEFSELDTITLSSATNILDYMCFDGCSSLSRIVAPYNDVMASAEVAFGSTPYAGITLAVPANLVQSYQGAMFWYEFNVVAIEDEGGGNDPVQEDKLLDSGADVGPEASWELYESGRLVIKGSSYLYGYTYYQDIPWYIYRQQITSVQVEEGIQSLMKCAFFDCINLSSVTLPASLCCIDDSTFYNCTSLSTIVCTRENPPSVNGMYPFGDITLSDITLKVPEGSGIFYESADYWKQMQIVEEGSSTSQLEAYQLEYIFVNSIGISGFDPNIYNYDAVLSDCSETPQLSFMRGNNEQEVEVIQPTSANSTGYINVSVDGQVAATYTINFTCENAGSEYITIPLSHDWRFIMLPSVFGLSANDITIDGEVEWATYDGYQRASGQSGWKTVDLSSLYSQEKACIVRAVNDTATLIISVPAAAKDSVEVSVNLALYNATHPQNAHWNFVGNPYAVGYNIDGLAAFGIESPITVWNGVGYSTYTPGIDSYVLQPFEAFFIQHTEDGAARLHFLPQYLESVNGNKNQGSNVNTDEGALSGYFSVGEGQTVRFSKGNLQYNPYQDKWQFAENQYDYVGESNANIAEGYIGWIDLFGWGTGNNPTTVSSNYSDYENFFDWGANPINNGGNVGGLWRTLTSDEWAYLFESRANALQLFGLASVNGVNGMVILPDDFYEWGSITFTSGTSDGFNTNTLDLTNWILLQSAGAVFLPAAGVRDGLNVYSIGRDANYWSSTPSGANFAYLLYFGVDGLNPRDNNVGRDGGRSVRLVK